MATILKNLPLYGHRAQREQASKIIFTPGGAGYDTIRDYEIVFWVSLTRADSNKAGLPFPVILDTGFSSTLSLSQSHCVEYAQLRPGSRSLPAMSHIRPHRTFDPRGGLLEGSLSRPTPVPTYKAKLWIHPNQEGRRDCSERPAIAGNLDAGVAVYQEGRSDAPRLPLIGLRALLGFDLNICARPAQGRVDLRSPSWLDWIGIG